MSEESSESGASTSVSAQVTQDLVDEFDLALKKAQIEGNVPMNVSRSQVIRGLLKIAAEDRELMSEAVDRGEQ